MGPLAIQERGVTAPGPSADRSPLRRLLEDTAVEQCCSMKDLTVLAVQNDPFRIDTPAGHRDGEWLAMNAERLGLADRTIHLRGLHYALVTDAPAKPNGGTYRNTEADWEWLQDKAADAARWLGYIGFDRIVDQRNDKPTVRVHKPLQPWPYLSVGIDVDIPDAADVEPRVGVLNFDGVQPYKLVLIGEKSSLAEALDPIADRYTADLYLPTGEISDTLIYQLAKVGAEDGRPMVVFYFSDADPAGWQMPISVSRKLQAFTALGTVDVPVQDGYGNGYARQVDFADLQFEVHRVALTPDQVREYELPSTPLKATEKRADAWQEAMGVEQTEIDALASLRPDLLRQLARGAIEPFYDSTLASRVWQARDEWHRQAQTIVDEAIDQDRLDRLRDEAARKLAELRDEIDAINNALQLDASDFDLPPAVVPVAEADGSNGLPLLDSRWSFAEQTRALIESKAYRGSGGPA